MIYDFSRMSQYLVERRLAASYAVCVLMGAIASITPGIAWSHWKVTLDQCRIGTNCSCILFSRHTQTRFLGGDIAPCIWVTFGPLLYILFCLAMTCFHGYRVLFSFQTSRARTIMTKNEAGQMVQMHAVQAEDTNPLPKAFWVTMSTFSVAFGVYSLVHFLVFLVGYYKTCNEYRTTLEQMLHGSGNLLSVIHNRLACQGVFDFMDYLQQDTSYYYEGIINTGLDLTLGIIASSFSCMLFVYASVCNIKMALLQY